MRKFEYKRVREVDLQGSRLDELGELGWELITIRPERIPTGGAEHMWIFKRDWVHPLQAEIVPTPTPTGGKPIRKF